MLDEPVWLHLMRAGLGEPLSLLLLPHVGDTDGLDLKNFQSTDEIGIIEKPSWSGSLGEGPGSDHVTPCVWEYERVGKKSLRTRKMEGFSDFPLSEA